MIVMRRLCTMAFILLLNEACTTSTPVSVFHRFDELEMSRNFSSQTISSKPFVMNVIGLEKLAKLREASFSSAQATELLAEEFQRIRPELTPHEPSFTLQEKKSLQGILDAFGMQQEFPADGYAFLQKPSLAKSWFLIADVERMGIEQDMKEEEIKDLEGKRIHTKFSYFTIRLLDVRYFIYDPGARHLVFMGLVRSTTTATHDRIGNGDESDFPEAPGKAKSLSQNFQKFLQALPKTQGH